MTSFKYNFQGNIFLGGDAPHDILQTEQTFPCHENVKLYSILRDS